MDRQIFYTLHVRSPYPVEWDHSISDDEQIKFHFFFRRPLCPLLVHFPYPFPPLHVRYYPVVIRFTSGEMDSELMSNRHLG